MKKKTTFEEFLRRENLSDNPLDAYLWTVDYYTSHYDGISRENLLAYPIAETSHMRISQYAGGIPDKAIFAADALLQALAEKIAIGQYI